VKFVIIFIVFFLNTYAIDILVSSKNIKYKEYLNYENLVVTSTSKKVRCTMFNKEELLNNKYEAKRYIIKGKAICNKDVKISQNSQISYDFGNIVIQRNGIVIGETKKYIKVKNNDGSIDKIFKNGQLR